MDKLFLAVILVAAVAYLYVRLVKNRGCGCGKKTCCNQKSEQ